MSRFERRNRESLLLLWSRRQTMDGCRRQKRGDILSKSEDPAFRRVWIHRLHDHDGSAPGEGGLAQWLKLAEAVGLDAAEVASCRGVLPGVRFACDAYVELVRASPLVVAVASSLTEFFAPDLMSRRIEAWEADPNALPRNDG